MSSFVLIFCIACFFFAALSSILFLRQSEFFTNEEEHGWQKSFLDDGEKSRYELIEEIRGELNRLHVLKSATIVDTSRGILDETQQSIDEIQRRVVDEAGGQIREGARRIIRQEADEQLDKLRENRRMLENKLETSSAESREKIREAQAELQNVRRKRDELERRLEDSSAESKRTISALRERLARAKPQRTAKPNVVGMKGGNAHTAGNDLPSGNIFYCKNGNMDVTYRVTFKENGKTESPPADLTLRIDSSTYKQPIVKAKFDRPMTGEAILEAKDHYRGMFPKQVASKMIRNDREVSWGCPSV